MAEKLLEIEDLSLGYGDGVVLHDLSLSVEAGRSLCVLGRNGVGKSTLMLAIAGHLSPRSGSIRLAGRRLEGLSAYERCRLGIGWVPQGREVFRSLSVEENVAIAIAPGPWTQRRVFALFPRLEERKRNLAHQLSGGEQQMLAIARALVTNPRLLLLDEPLEGLAPVVAQDVARCIRQIVDEDGISTILIEQHAGFALGLAHQAAILERGVVVRAGTSAEVAADHAALERYVGIRKTEPRRTK